MEFKKFHTTGIIQIPQYNSVFAGFGWSLVLSALINILPYLKEWVTQKWKYA